MTKRLDTSVIDDECRKLWRIVFCRNKVIEDGIREANIAVSAYRQQFAGVSLSRTGEIIGLSVRENSSARKQYEDRKEKDISNETCPKCGYTFPSVEGCPHCIWDDVAIEQ